MKKNIRKLLLLLAVVITALVCFAVSASAKTVPASGKCGNNVTYTYNSSLRGAFFIGTVRGLPLAVYTKTKLQSFI